MTFDSSFVALVFLNFGYFLVAGFNVIYDFILPLCYRFILPLMLLKVI